MRITPPGSIIGSTRRGPDAPVFTPVQLTSLHAWWDASLETYSNGAAVTSLTDRSGNGRTLSQATGANQPTFSTNQINANPVISFDGVNDYLTTALNAFTNFNQMTVFGALRTGATVSGTYYWLTGVNAAVNAEVAFGITSSVFIESGTSLAVGSAAAASTNYRLACVYNSTSSSIMVNGTTTSGLNVGLTNTASYRMGATNSAAVPWNGLIGEVIVYNRVLTAAEIALVDLYLSRKWGI